MARLDSKQLNPALTGSFTLSGSFTGDSTSTGSFGTVNVNGDDFNTAVSKSAVIGGFSGGGFGTFLRLSGSESLTGSLLITQHGGASGNLEAEGNISSSATSTGSFGKLEVGSATIQIPSNGFITMGSLDGMVMNTRFGNNAGQNLESGGTQNVLIGEDAGSALTTGDTNVAVGSEALKAATGDSNNVAIGRRALHDLNTTNARNVAVGTAAGDGMTSGTANVLLGHGTNTSAVDGTNQIVIGSSVTGLGDNQTVIGNSSQTHVVFGGDALISGSASSTGSFGMIGVGIANPDEKLHVENGNIKLGDSTDTVRHIRFERNGAFVGSIGTNNSMLSLIGGTGTGTNGLNVHSSGQVSIGSVTPDALLHLYSSAAPEIRVQDSTNNSIIEMQARDNDTRLGTTSNHPIDIRTNATSAVYIDTSQNVGIGTTNPTRALDVVGDIKATGDVIAENYIVSSSVVHLTQSFSSGSTIFGDTADDVHEFFGDTISGSATSTGSFGLVNTTEKINLGSGGVSIEGSSAGTLTANVDNQTLFNILHSNGDGIGAYLTTTNMVNFGAKGSSKLGIGHSTGNIQQMVFNTDGNIGLGDSFDTRFIDRAKIFIENGGDVTINSDLIVTGSISGSSTSSGSFGHLQISNNDVYGRANGIAIGTAASFNSPSLAFEVTKEIDNNYVALLRNLEATAGRNFGLYIRAGSNTSDYGLQIRDKDDSLLTRVDGAGNLLLNAGDVRLTSGNVSGSVTSTGSFGRGFIDDKLSVNCDPFEPYNLTVKGGDTSGGAFFYAAQTSDQYIALIPRQDFTMYMKVGYGLEIRQNQVNGIQGDFSVSQNGTKRLLIKASSGADHGFVGINETSPTEQLHVDGNILSTGNIVAEGNITAQNFIVSSSVTSITYQSLSGSTLFGDDIGDTHRFTGSLSTSGSLQVVGEALIGTGSQAASVGVTSGQVDLLVKPNIPNIGDYTTRLVVEQPNSHSYKSDAEIHVHGYNDGRLYVGGNRQRKIIFKTNNTEASAAESWTIGTPDDSTDFQISALNSTVQAILINKTSGNITAVGNISSSAASTGSFGRVVVPARPSGGPITLGGGAFQDVIIGDGSGTADIVLDGNSESVIRYKIGGNEKWFLLARSSNNFVFRRNSADRVTIDTNGNFAIGSNLVPTERLHVGGNIFATGNISGSSTSTGSFSRVLAPIFGGFGVVSGDVDDSTAAILHVRDQTDGSAKHSFRVMQNPSSTEASVDTLKVRGETSANALGIYQFGTGNIAEFLDGNTSVATIDQKGSVSGSSTSTGSFGSVIVDNNLNIGTEIEGLGGVFELKSAGLTFTGNGGQVTFGAQTTSFNHSLGKVYTRFDSGYGGGGNEAFKATDHPVAAGFWVDSVGNMQFGHDDGAGVRNTVQMMTLGPQAGHASGSLLVSGSIIAKEGNISGSSTSTGSFGDGRFASKVGIGLGITTALSTPHSYLDVRGNNVTPSNGNGSYHTMQLIDTSTSDEGVGGGIGFGGKFVGNSDTLFGEIRGLKENATSNNYAGALTFQTRAHGANLIEQVRIDSSGNLEAVRGNISGSSTSTGSFGLVLQNGSPISGDSFSDGTPTLISGSATSTGSFGKLQVGSATIQIPSNGFITMGSLDGMVKNTRFGVNAGNSLQSGGQQNVLIGEEAGAALTTGDKNIVMGVEALKTETGGQNNVAIGHRALKTLNQNSVGGNVALGHGAAEDLATGAFNILIGYAPETQATDDTRSIVIGSEDTVGLGSNTTVIGGASQTLVAFGGSDTTLTLSGSMEISGSGPATSASLHIRDFSYTDTHILSESLVVAVDGNNGRLFSVTDQMTGSLFSANTVAGLPVIEAFSDNKVTLGPFSSQVIVDSDGNISGSATSTGSFGTIQMPGISIGNGTNTFFGKDAGKVHGANGANNLAIGLNAMDDTDAGSTSLSSDENVFIGHNAGGGTWVNNNSRFNTSVGNNSMAAAFNGALSNTSVGYNSLNKMTEGDSNIAMGSQAGEEITTGAGNTCIGTGAGKETLATGDDNVLVGKNVDTSAAGSANQIVIGVGITAAGDNDFAFGKASNVVHNDFDADAAWSRTSDIRKKRNIQEDKLGLEFINKLKPVTHQWKPSNEFPKEWEEYNEENQMNLDVVIHNMIAQDVKKALDEVGCDTFGGWKEREDGSQTISREMFVTPLINAVKELSEQNKELEKRIQELENKKE